MLLIQYLIVPILQFMLVIFIQTYKRYYNQRLLYLMSETQQLFQKLRTLFKKEVLFEQKHEYFQTSSTKSEFKQLLNLHLKKQLAAQEALSNLDQQFSKDNLYGTHYLDKAASKMEIATGNNTTSQRIKELINKQKQLRQQIENKQKKLKQQIENKQKQLQNKQKQIKKQRQVKDKLITDNHSTIQFYKSFLIWASAKSPNYSQLSEQQKKHLIYYEQNYSKYAIGMSSHFTQILLNRDQSIKINNFSHLVSELQNFVGPSSINSKNYILKLQDSLRLSLNLFKQLTNFINNQKQLIIQKKKNTYFNLSSPIKKSKLNEPLSTLIQTIESLYQKQKQQKYTSRTIYLHQQPSKTIRISSYCPIQNLTYDSLMNYIDQLYQQIKEPKHRSIPLKQKMQIIRVTLTYYTSSNYTQLVTSEAEFYKEQINLLVEKCFKYFQKPKQSIAQNKYLFTFQKQDVIELNKIINTYTEIYRPESILKQQLETLQKKYQQLDLQRSKLAFFTNKISLEIELFDKQANQSRINLFSETNYNQKIQIFKQITIKLFHLLGEMRQLKRVNEAYQQQKIKTSQKLQQNQYVGGLLTPPNSKKIDSGDQSPSQWNTSAKQQTDKILYAAHSNKTSILQQKQGQLNSLKTHLSMQTNHAKDLLAMKERQILDRNIKLRQNSNQILTLTKEVQSMKQYKLNFDQTSLNLSKELQIIKQNQKSLQNQKLSLQNENIRLKESNVMLIQQSKVEIQKVQHKFQGIIHQIQQNHTKQAKKEQIKFNQFLNKYINQALMKQKQQIQTSFAQCIHQSKLQYQQQLNNLKKQHLQYLQILKKQFSMEKHKLISQKQQICQESSIIKNNFQNNIKNLDDLIENLSLQSSNLKLQNQGKNQEIQNQKRQIQSLKRQISQILNLHNTYICKSSTCYQRLKKIFIEGESIEEQKFNKKSSPQMVEFDQFLQKYIGPFIRAFEAFQIMKQITQPLRKRKSVDPKQLLSKLTEITQSDECEKNIRYFFEKQNEISKANMFVKNITFDQIDNTLQFNQKIRQIVAAFNLQKSFLAYIANPQIPQITKQYQQFRTDYKVFLERRKYESSFSTQFQAVQQYKAQALTFRQVIEQFKKNDQGFRQIESYSQKAKFITQNLRQIKEEQLRVQQILGKIIQTLRRTKNVPDINRISIKLKNEQIQKQFKQLLTTFRTISQEKNQVAVQSKGTVYLPTQGITYSDLTKYINSLYSQIFNENEPKLKIKMQKINDFCINQRDYAPQISSQQIKLQQSLNKFIIKLYKVLDNKRINQESNILAEEIEMIDSQLENIFLKKSQLEQMGKQLQFERQNLKCQLIKQKADSEKIQGILNSILQAKFKQNQNNQEKRSFQQKIKKYQSESLVIINILKQNEVFGEKESFNKSITQIQEIKTTENLNNEISTVEYKELYVKQINKIQELQKQIVNLKQQLQVQNQNIEILEKERSKLNNQVKQLKNKLLNSQNSREKLLQNFSDIQNNYKINLQQKQQTIVNLELQLQQNKKSNELQIIQAEKVQLEIKIEQLQYSYNSIKEENIQMHQDLKTFKLNHDQQILELLQKEKLKKQQLQNLMDFLKKTLNEERETEILEISQRYQESNYYLKNQIDIKTEELQKLKQQLHAQIGLRLCAMAFERGQKSKVQQTEKQKIQQANHSKKQENILINHNKLLELEKQYKLKFEDEIRKLKQDIQKLKNDIKSLRQQNQSLMQRIYEKNLDNQVQLKQNQKLEEQILQLSKQNAILQSQMEMLKENNKVIEKSFARHSNIFNVIQDINQQQEQNKETLPKLLIPYTKPLFNQDIFLNDQISKEKLIAHIEDYTRSRIARTALLYKYDTRNKANFHQYIDQVKGLALVIKTKNAIVAGFYPEVHKDKQVLNKGGLLISVTNDQSYRLFTKKPGDQSKTIYRGMIYDTYFAIFGNAQIRVKTGFKTVFSNFGASNGYFDSRGDRIDKFFNEGQTREIQFQFCEFYQIHDQQR